MPAGQATSLDASNIVAIFDAVHDIALNKSGLAWGSNQQYEYPAGAAIQDAAKPLLVTTCPEFNTFTQDGQPGGSKEMVREMGLVEPTWDIYVFGVFNYEAGNPDSWRTPLQYLSQLIQTFGIYWGLELTCSHGNPTNLNVSKIHTRDNFTFMESQLVVRAYEALVFNP